MAALIDLTDGTIRASSDIAAGAIRADAEPLHDPTGDSMTLGWGAREEPLSHLSPHLPVGHYRWVG